MQSNSWHNTNIKKTYLERSQSSAPALFLLLGVLWWELLRVKRWDDLNINNFVPKMFKALIADAFDRESNSRGCYWCCQCGGPCLYFRGTQFDFFRLLFTLVSNSLTTDSCCWDFTDVTLAFEDANSKLLDVFNIADVDAEERVDDSLVEILKLKFGQEFWLKILKLKFELNS